MRILTNSAQETVKAGQALAKKLKSGVVVLLEGELGGGKTTFVKGLVKGLGIKARVASPTFTLLRQYKKKGLTVNHLDFYRLDNIADIYAIGLDEYLYARDSLTFIEWGEKIEPSLPAYFKITFRHAGGDCRRITVAAKK